MRTASTTSPTRLFRELRPFARERALVVLAKLRDLLQRHEAPEQGKLAIPRRPWAD